MMEACSANAKSSKTVVQPTARDLTNHMAPETRTAAMARIRCVLRGFVQSDLLLLRRHVCLARYCVVFVAVRQQHVVHL